MPLGNDQTFGNDPAALAFQSARIAHWDKVARAVRPGRDRLLRRHYRRYLSRVHRFLIPEGARVLELGCGEGDLLASLAPSLGVGVDFSPAMLDLARQRHPHLRFIQADAHSPDWGAGDLGGADSFDAVILSDLVNDVWDLRMIFDALRRRCSPATRIFMNFHSHLWETPFQWLQALGLVTPRLPQNWFTPDDVENLAALAGFERIRRFSGLLCPLPIPGANALFNRLLSRLWPFRALNLVHFLAFRALPNPEQPKSVSVVIPARNEAGNIEAAVQRTPDMGAGTELVFVEGGSSDGTWEVIQAMAAKYPERGIKALRQDGKGKGDAVRKGFDAAGGEILMILDADLTMPPETLPQFYDALASGRAEFVNGARLVYPREGGAMRFANLCANKFFSLAFSWLLERPIKDTLCGTKAINRDNYRRLIAGRAYFGEFDPFGDFDLLFGAAKLNLQIRDLPVRYRDRTYGETNISRWRDGLILLRMVIFAARKIKFW